MRLQFQKPSRQSRTSFLIEKKSVGNEVGILYRHICLKNESILQGYRMEDLLEIIDRLRIPLAEKVFDGVALSEDEQNHLELLEGLTENLLLNIAPKPEVPQDVKSALQHAKSLMAKHQMPKGITTGRSKHAAG